MYPIQQRLDWGQHRLPASVLVHLLALALWVVGFGLGSSGARSSSSGSGIFVCSTGVFLEGNVVFFLRWHAAAPLGPPPLPVSARTQGDSGAEGHAFEVVPGAGMRVHPVGGVWANPLQFVARAAVIPGIFLRLHHRQPVVLLSCGAQKFQMRQAVGMAVRGVFAFRHELEQRDGRERLACRPCFFGVCAFNKLKSFLVGCMGRYQPPGRMAFASGDQPHHHGHPRCEARGGAAGGGRQHPLLALPGACRHGAGATELHVQTVLLYCTPKKIIMSTKTNTRCCYPYSFEQRGVSGDHNHQAGQPAQRHSWEHRRSAVLLPPPASVFCRAGEKSGG